MKPLHELDGATISRLITQGHDSPWFPSEDVARAVVKDIAYYFVAGDLEMDSTSPEGQLALSCLCAAYTNALRVGFQAAAEQVQDAPPPS